MTIIPQILHSVNLFSKLLLDKGICIHDLPKNLTDLEKNMRQLKAKRNDVQRRVKTEAEISGHQPYEEVQLWLQDVESVEKEADDLFRKKDLFEKDFVKVILFRIEPSYQYAKRVCLMLKEISDLKSRGSFLVVAGPATNSGTKQRPSATQMTRGGLRMAAMSYVAIDYMRYVSPVWHSRLMSVLWSVLAIGIVTRVLFYKHWSKELRAAIPFLGSIVFMLCALHFEALCVRSVTAVLGLDWHRAQREIRERHHYTVDCIVAIYVGILLWKMTGFIWSDKRETKQTQLEKIQNRLIHAAKDSDMEAVRRLVEEMETSSGEEKQSKVVSNQTMTVFACATVITTLTIVILALTLTSDG